MQLHRRKWRDAGYKPILEGAAVPALFVRHIMWECAEPQDWASHHKPPASKEVATTRQRPSGITLRIMVELEFQTCVYKSNKTELSKKNKRPKTNRTQTTRVWFKNADWCTVYIAPSHKNSIFQRKTFKYIWINLITQPNLEEALLVLFNSKYNLEFYFISF